MPFSEIELLKCYKFTSKKPVLVDVGAHEGEFSCTFARRNWQVIAFEPEPKNRAVFESRLRNFEQVVCLPYAVSDVSGSKAPFYVSDEHYGIHSLRPFHETHNHAFDVETIRLDDVLRSLQVSKVTLLKIDIEGADFLALKSLDFNISRPELVMIEFMDERSLKNFGYTHHDVAKYMEYLGYVTFVSEWAPFAEYGRKGMPGTPHTWLGCHRYPLNHAPAWGNLFFVPYKDTGKFTGTLSHYLKYLRQATQPNLLYRLGKRIPGVRFIYRKLTQQ